MAEQRHGGTIPPSEVPRYMLEGQPIIAKHYCNFCEAPMKEGDYQFAARTGQKYLCQACVALVVDTAKQVARWAEARETARASGDLNLMAEIDYGDGPLEMSQVHDPENFSPVVVPEPAPLLRPLSDSNPLIRLWRWFLGTFFGR